MWISRAHFDLIRERASEFRAWHEERMRDKEAVIRSQEARLAVLETERRELTERLWTRETERTRMPEPLPPAPEDNWEAIMRKQIEEFNAPEAQ